MSVDMFLKIDDIKGESADGSHRGQIDVLSWNWSMTQGSTTHTGGGGGAAKVSVKDIMVTKYVDAATPNLIKMCCNGKHFKLATLTVRKAGDKPLEYLKISMEEGIISGLTTGASAGDDRLTESITLNFSRFKVEYRPQKADGTGDAAIVAAWNIATNSPA